ERIETREQFFVREVGELHGAFVPSLFSAPTLARYRAIARAETSTLLARANAGGRGEEHSLRARFGFQAWGFAR
ncbi:MAG TPA: hypothetical protein VNO21_10940, partial [Polyangiaceae bacterium]|nr:hypothetical protein [Polyangiaceae bacterium]